MEKHTQEAKYKGKNKGRNGIASGFGYATKLRKSFESCKRFRAAAQLYATRPALNRNGLCIYMHKSVCKSNNLTSNNITI